MDAYMARYEALGPMGPVHPGAGARAGDALAPLRRRHGALPHTVSQALQTRATALPLARVEPRRCRAAAREPPASLLPCPWASLRRFLSRWFRPGCRLPTPFMPTHPHSASTGADSNSHTRPCQRARIPG